MSVLSKLCQLLHFIIVFVVFLFIFSYLYQCISLCVCIVKDISVILFVIVCNTCSVCDHVLSACLCVCFLKTSYQYNPFVILVSLGLHEQCVCVHVCCEHSVWFGLLLFFLHFSKFWFAMNLSFFHSVYLIVVQFYIS